MIVHNPRSRPDSPSWVRAHGALLAAAGDETVYDRVKMTAEFVAALVLLLATAPVIALAGLAVRLTSPGPVFYTQVRLGRRGRPYTIFKLRTMTYNCEAISGACWAAPVDPRVTFVGRVLRKTHLDELPQLWNVLRGEMSLIGPRPERPEIVERIEPLLPDYRGRLRVRPGLTGLAQIQLPPDTDVAQVAGKLRLDLVYVQRRGPWLDCRIVLGTALYLCGIPFAVIGKLLLLPPQPPLPEPAAAADPQLEPA